MCIKQNNSGIHRAHGLQRLSECNRVMERLWQRDTAKRQMMKLCIFPASISNKLVWYNSSKQCICITNAKNPIHFASAERMGFCLLRPRPKPHVERNLSDCRLRDFSKSLQLLISYASLHSRLNRTRKALAFRWMCCPLSIDICPQYAIIQPNKMADADSSRSLTSACIFHFQKGAMLPVQIVRPPTTAP